VVKIATFANPENVITNAPTIEQMAIQMTKRSLIILLTCAILTILGLKFIGYYRKEDKGFLGFFGRLLNKTNNFEVTYSNVDKKDFDIIWSTEEGTIDTLVNNGNKTSNFGYEYGREKFIIIYKGRAVCSDEFFSTNDNNPHDVEINISKSGESFVITYLIDKTKKMTLLDFEEL
jgi:hypothetical protein